MPLQHLGAARTKVHNALLLKLEQPRIYLSLVIPARRKLKASARKYTCAGGLSWKRATSGRLPLTTSWRSRRRSRLEDLNRVREAHAKLGSSDIEQGLVEAGQEAQTGMQVAVENKTEPSTRMTRSNSSSRTSTSLPIISFLLISIFAISLGSVSKHFSLLSKTFRSGTRIKPQPLSGPENLLGSSASSSLQRESTST